MGPTSIYVLSMFALSVGRHEYGPAHGHRFSNKDACTKSVPAWEKWMDKRYPEATVVNVACIREGGTPMRELLGEAGWGCYRYGRCLQGAPKATFKGKTSSGEAFEGRID